MNIYLKLILVVVGFSLISLCYSESSSNSSVLSINAEKKQEIQSLTAKECKERAGSIINTLSDENCRNNENLIGVVKGMRCPCVCCVAKTEN